MMTKFPIYVNNQMMHKLKLTLKTGKMAYSVNKGHNYEMQFS